MTSTKKMVQFVLTAPGESLARVERDFPEPAPGEALIEVAGCGVCHTDLGFYSGAVRTKRPLPLTLGHEISGTVAAVAPGDPAGRGWLGRAVIVPAVVPCGDCPSCSRGRASICPRQIFFGNDLDGGFATHVMAPLRGLCPVPGWEPGRPVGRSGVGLPELAVMADAVTTAYQSVIRSHLKEGDLAVVVGAGGVGGFAVQIAAALGATVAALDIDAQRLEPLRDHGAALTINVRGKSADDVRQEIRSFARERLLPSREWKLFETSGTTDGQALAFRLLNHGARLTIVGFVPAEVSVRLSNLMALDATAAGNWGCLPERYPEALKLVLEGRVAIGPFAERRPLRDVQEVLEALQAGRLVRRAVLVPEEGA